MGVREHLLESSSTKEVTVSVGPGGTPGMTFLARNWRFKCSDSTLSRDQHHARGCMSRPRAEGANGMEQMGFIQRAAWLTRGHPPVRIGSDMLADTRSCRG